MSIVTYFSKGGIFMWPLLVCSIIALAVILERYLFFKRNTIEKEKFKNELKSLLMNKKLEIVIEYTSNYSNSIAKIAYIFVSNFLNPERDKILSNQATLFIEKEEKNLQILAVIIQIAPLIGLLGTVAGLVESFKEIESLGSLVKPSDLAAGIWAALMTTVFGLVIAIPAIIFHNWFESKINYHIKHMEIMITDLEIWMKKRTNTLNKNLT